MTYDKICVGGSLAMLIYAHSLGQGNHLILEGQKYMGGAWASSNATVRSVDLGCHVIVPPTDEDGQRIVEYFGALGIRLIPVSPNSFYYDSDSWKSYGKGGTPLICARGWPYFLDRMLELIQQEGYVTIKKEHKITEISFSKSTTSLYSHNQRYRCSQAIVPSYAQLATITCPDGLLEIPFNLVTNKHLVLEIEDKDISVPSCFQGFYEKSPTGIFDRVSVSNACGAYYIFTARISKSHKEEPLDLSGERYVEFLKSKNIVSANAECANVETAFYKCAYRTPEERELLKEASHQNPQRIKFLESHYLGHFLAKLVNGTI